MAQNVQFDIEADLQRLDSVVANSANYDRQKQQNINRYVHAYYSDNAEVTMELEGIDLMFSNQEVKPMPVKEYREYMKECNREAKDYKQK